jgi:hypothetical protein
MFTTMSSSAVSSPGLRNVFDVYVGAVDAWQVYDNGELSGPRLLASRASGAAVEISDPAGWKRLEEVIR